MNGDLRQVRLTVARWLSSHHGVITWEKARQLGLSPAQIAYLVRSGGWERVHVGVYRLAAAPATGFDAVYAAVLAAGEGAVASHLSAAWLWDLRTDRPSRTTVTVSHDRRPRPAGVRIARSRHPVHPLRRRGVPATSVARTLMDCANELPADELDLLVDTAIARKATTIAVLTKAAFQRELCRYPGRKQLAERLELRGIAGSPNPSVLESRMSRLLRRHRLPAPKAEVEWGRDRQYRIDFAYPAIRLAIEVDGWATHFSPEQQRRDHRRQRRLNMAGWTVLHFDWWEVTYEPERVAGEIAAAYRILAAA